MDLIYMVRNTRTKDFAEGPSTWPKWRTGYGRMWSSIAAVRNWVEAYNTGHIWYRDEPVHDTVEIVQFELTERGLIPEIDHE
jgi:hypothetical protein